MQAAKVPDGVGGGDASDRLDALEAQSIFILREAFARLKRIALLWSLGKDSNALIWLGRKAFFGRLPFPVMHVDTRSLPKCTLSASAMRANGTSI